MAACVALGAVATFVACASLDGLTGDAGDAGDATDGSADRDVIEASAVPEGGPDAAPGPDATTPPPDAGPGFCQGVDAAFCADFDDGGVGTGWTELLVTSGTLGLDSKVASSLPSSLVMATVDGGADAFLRKALPLTGTLRLTADIFQQCTSMSQAEWAVLELRCTTSSGEVGGVSFSIAAFGPHKVRAVRNGLGPVVMTPFDVPLAPGAWRNLVIEAAFDAPGMLSVSVDGVNLVSAAPSMGCLNTASRDLVVELIGASNRECRVNIDNVVLVY